MSYWVGAGAGTGTVEGRRDDDADDARSSKLNKQRHLFLSCNSNSNNPANGGSESDRRKQQAMAEESLHKVMYLNCWAQS
ncbi:hypothetical protein ACE6H2_013135 [Prunus campanulata]